LSIIGDESAIPSLEKAACDKNQVVQKVATLAVSEIKKRI
jgi:HEAT repeat protein